MLTNGDLHRAILRAAALGSRPQVRQLARLIHEAVQNQLIDGDEAAGLAQHFGVETACESRMSSLPTNIVHAMTYHLGLSPVSLAEPSWLLGGDVVSRMSAGKGKPTVSTLHPDGGLWPTSSSRCAAA